MADDDLTLSTSTDSTAVAQATLDGNEEGARVPIEQHASLSGFRESESEDGKTASLSYESPISSRHLVEQQLAQAEAELAQLAQPAEPEPAETGVDIERVREAATEDAIAFARARIAAQQQPVNMEGLQAEYSALMQDARANFDERMQELKSKDDPAEVARIAQQLANGGDVAFHPQVLEALIGLPGGPDAVYFLAKHLKEAREISRLPEHLGIARVAQLAARLTSPAVRARSAAPAPIKPVNGSARVDKSPDSMSFSEYKTWRQRTSGRRA